MAKYIITKKVGKHYPGEIVDDSSLWVRRRLQEGDCLEKYKSEKKMDTQEEENKMAEEKYENKGGKK